jgi:hypothetical protein
MNRQEVITIIDTLADGVDPATGERIPYEAFHTATAVRALFAASAFLKSDTGRARGAKSTTFTAAGAPWTAEEDARLGQEFDAGLTVAQIALQHGRTSGAITSRLVKIGRLDPEKVKARERGGRVVS